MNLMLLPGCGPGVGLRILGHHAPDQVLGAFLQRRVEKDGVLLGSAQIQ